MSGKGGWSLALLAGAVGVSSCTQSESTAPANVHAQHIVSAMSPKAFERAGLVTAVSCGDCSLSFDGRRAEGRVCSGSALRCASGRRGFGPSLGEPVAGRPGLRADEARGDSVRAGQAWPDATGGGGIHRDRHRSDGADVRGSCVRRRRDARASRPLDIARLVVRVESAGAARAVQS